MNRQTILLVDDEEDIRLVRRVALTDMGYNVIAAENGKEALRLVEGIIGLAHGLELPVVAEGVETSRQKELLREAGCDLYQGYLLGRPAPATEISGRLSTPAGRE